MIVRQVSKWFHVLIFASILFALVVPSVQARTEGVDFQTKKASSLLQFTSAGHILGFTPDGYYAAAGAHALHVEFANANPVQPASSMAQASGNHASPLGKITYNNLWDGITLAYSAPSGGILQSMYTLKPGANPADIRLKYNAPLAISADGALTVAYRTGQVSESAPIAWQQLDGRRVSVAVRFQQYGRNEAGFALGAYDPAYALIIDPILRWSTFIGGSGDETGSGIALDASGNIYVVGDSDASWGSPVRAYSVGATTFDAYAAKLSSSGALVWNTFLGSTFDDHGNGVGVDGSGNVYVTGWSDGGAWSCSPISCTKNAYSNVDSFVAKLDGNGALQWNYFLGGVGLDTAAGISVDSAGNSFATGFGDASWGVPINPFGGGANDAYAIRLNTNGSRIWNTFMGGSGDDQGTGITMDGNGEIFVTGFSSSTWGTPVRAHGLLNDAFVVKLNSANGSRTWSTFLGGSGNDSGTAIATDGIGNLYAAGTSSSAWSCAPTACTVRAYSSGTDGFVAQLDTASAALNWNTFQGGSGTDASSGIIEDGNGNIFVTGTSSATWGPPAAGQGFVGGTDAFLAKLNTSGSQSLNAFFGSSLSDQSGVVVANFNGTAYMIGRSNATWGSPINPHNSSGSNYDAFLAMVDTVAPLAVSFTLQDPAMTPTNADALTFRAAFNEDVTGVSASDFAVTGTTASVSGVTPVTASEYDVTVSGGNLANLNGSVGLDFALSAGITDIAGNAFVAAEPATDLIYDLDNIAPTVTVNQAAGQADPTNVSPIKYTATFSEPIDTLTLADSDVTLGGLAGTSPVITEIDPFDSTTFEVAVTGLSGSGAVLASINAGQVQDFAGNNNIASTSTDNSVTYDVVPPAITSFTLQTPAASPTNADTLIFRATFSEAVSGVAIADFAKNGSTTAAVTGVSSVTTSTYDVTISGGDLAGFNGTVGLDFAAAPTITDLAGNAFVKAEPATDQTYLLDNNAPTLTVNQAAGQADPTNAFPINFTATFNEAINTASFTSGDVTLSGLSGISAVITQVAPNNGTTFNIAVSGVPGAGNITASIVASMVQDLAGNNNTFSTSTDNTVAYDGVPPTITSFIRQAPAASPTNADALIFRATFSEAVTGVDTGDFAVNGTTSAAPTSVSPFSTSIYDVTISGGDLAGFNGVVGLDFAATPTITDLATNAFVKAEPTTDQTYLMDNIVPTVTVNQAAGQTDPTNASTINFTATFSEAINVASFTSGDVTLGGLGGTSAAITQIAPNNGTTFNIAVTGMSGAGSVTASINAATVQDPAGNDNTASTSTDNTVAYDGVAPTITSFTLQTPANSPTNADTLIFRATFSESVSGVATADFAKNGTTTASVTLVSAVSASIYDVTISGGNLASFNGTVGLDFAASPSITDLAGNAFVKAEPTTDQTYVVDNAAPTLTLNQASGQADPTNASPINFTATFNEAINVSSFTSGDVTLGGLAGTSAAVTEMAPNNGTTFNIAVTGLSGVGAVTASIGAGTVQDLAGNNNTASTTSDNSVTYDSLAPTITSFTLQTPVTSPTNADTLIFRATFNEAVTGVASADFAVNGTTTATVTGVSAVTTSAYNVTISGGDLAGFNGTVGLDFAAAPAITDLAGNVFVKAEPATDQTFLVDNIAPTVSVGLPSISLTTSGPVSFPVTISGADTINLTSSGVTLNAAGTSGTAAVSNGTTATPTVAINSITGDGTLGITIKAGIASDTAGNTNAASAASATFTVDNTAPIALSFTRRTPAASPTNADTLTFRATFSEPVTGVSPTDFAINGSTTASIFSVGTVNTSTYDITISGGDLANFNGVVGLNFSASPTIFDAINNALLKAEPAIDQTYLMDNAGPAVTVEQAVGQSDPTHASPINFTATFNEPINTSSFTQADVTLGGSISGLSATVIEVSPNDGTTFNIAVTGMSGTGTVTASIDAGLIQDPLGNNGGASTSVDNSVTYDENAPTITSFTRQTPAASATNADTLIFRGTFSEDVSGVDASDFVVTGATAAPTLVTQVTPGEYDVTISGGDLASLNGTVGLDFNATAAITDLAGNTFVVAEPATDETYAVDNIAPDVSIDPPTPADPSNSANATFNFSSTDATAAFECDMDGAGFAACTNPKNYTGLSDGSHTFKVHSVDPAGNISADAAFTWLLDTAPPSVLSSIRVDVNPTSKKFVKFTVTFSEPVSGVDKTDFALTKTGVITGFSVTGLSNVGAVYTVTVNTGNGNGTLRLDVLNNGSIKDPANHTLASAFTTGQLYKVNKILTVTSQGINDGWILESTPTSNKGGAINKSFTTFRLGDDSARKQYRGLLSFSTGAGLPDNAIITKVTLRVKKQGVSGGGNPVTMFQGFMADVRQGTFGTAALQSIDFQSPANKFVGPFISAPLANWFTLNLTGAAPGINKLAASSGLTQIRLRFKLQDNGNIIANTLSLYSGNAPLASRPQLIIQYYVP